MQAQKAWNTWNQKQLEAWTTIWSKWDKQPMKWERQKWLEDDMYHCSCETIVFHHRKEFLWPGYKQRNPHKGHLVPISNECIRSRRRTATSARKSRSFCLPLNKMNSHHKAWWKLQQHVIQLEICKINYAYNYCQLFQKEVPHHLFDHTFHNLNEAYSVIHVKINKHKQKIIARTEIMNLWRILLSVSGPCSTTSPVISWPTTQGLANGISPLITWRSEWHTPQAARNNNHKITSQVCQTHPSFQWLLSSQELHPHPNPQKKREKKSIEHEYIKYQKDPLSIRRSLHYIIRGINMH